MEEGKDVQENLEMSESDKMQKFYKLHYPPRKQTQSPKRMEHGFRARSLISVIQSNNPEQNPKEMLIKHKKSHQIKQEKSEILPQRQQKYKKSKKKTDGFSFHKLLSNRMDIQQMNDYFTRYPAKSLFDVEEQARRNLTVRIALQKSKQEKVKIQKVLNSHKQSEETKLDYLQLKRKDIEQEIHEEIRGIYEEFFKKQYEELYGAKGFSEFQTKMRSAMGVLHQQIFNR